MPSGTTWEEFINLYGGSDAGFFIETNIIGYYSVPLQTFCIVIYPDRERRVQPSDEIIANETYVYGPV